MNTARLSCPSPPFQETARSCSPGTVSDLAAGPGMAPRAAGRAPDVFSPPDPRRSSEVVATACWLRAPLPAVSRQPVGSPARRCRSPPQGRSAAPAFPVSLLLAGISSSFAAAQQHRVPVTSLLSLQRSFHLDTERGLRLRIRHVFFSVYVKIEVTFQLRPCLPPGAPTV